VYADPLIPYLLTGTTDGADIFVGVNCFFGYAVRVQGNVRIGHGCVIGSGADVRADIPPFSIVVGQPAKVIKRFHFGQMEWVKWPCDDFVEGPPEEEYLRALKSNRSYFPMPLAAASGGYSDVP